MLDLYLDVESIRAAIHQIAASFVSGYLIIVIKKLLWEEKCERVHRRIWISSDMYP